MLISEKEIKENPIITDIKYKHFGDDEDCFELGIYGINKKIFEASGNCGSGSGWAYGAFINLHCKKKNLDINLAEY